MCYVRLLLVPCHVGILAINGKNPFNRDSFSHSHSSKHPRTSSDILGYPHSFTQSQTSPDIPTSSFKLPVPMYTQHIHVHSQEVDSGLILLQLYSQPFEWNMRSPHLTSSRPHILTSSHPHILTSSRPHIYSHILTHTHTYSHLLTHPLPHPHTHSLILIHFLTSTSISSSRPHIHSSTRGRVTSNTRSFPFKDFIFFVIFFLSSLASDNYFMCHTCTFITIILCMYVSM